jgi:hypothetical protein
MVRPGHPPGFGKVGTSKIAMVDQRFQVGSRLQSSSR